MPIIFVAIPASWSSNCLQFSCCDASIVVICLTTVHFAFCSLSVCTVLQFGAASGDKAMFRANKTGLSPPPFLPSSRLSVVFLLTSPTRFLWCSFCALVVLLPREGYASITKTHLYIEKFTTKNWKFSDKNSDIFHISAQNIDCGHSLEPPRQVLLYKSGV